MSEMNENTAWPSGGSESQAVSVWKCRYFDGKTPIAHTLDVTIVPTGLLLNFADGTDHWTFQDIIQTHGHYLGEPITIENPTRAGTSLVINDPAFIEAVKRVGGPDCLKPADRFQKTLTLQKFFIYGAMAVAVLLAAYYWVVPQSARWIAYHLPPSWEKKLGAGTVKLLLDEDMECRDPVVADNLAKIMERMKTDVPIDWFKIHVIKMSMPNAFAVPGGFIFVTSGLLKESDNPEEVAGVLAHEIQHIQNHHSTQQLIQQYSLSLLSGGFFSGESGQVTQFILGSAKLMGGLRYSRLHEAEADRFGLQLLIDSKIDIGGFKTFFEKMEKKDGKESKIFSYLSTHPSNENRIQMIKEFETKNRAAVPIKISKGLVWKDMVEKCAMTIPEKTPENSDEKKPGK